MSTDAARLRTYRGRTVTPMHVTTWEATRLLTRGERVAIRAAHEVEFWHDGAKWHAACACGTTFSSEHAHVVSDASGLHVTDVLDFAAGRKVAEARANVELERAVDRALSGQ